ncbi:hypothetical protein [Paraburkholderia sp.]|uniref:hypothetical protein n=1 Tax=Paraburkholderia sp. TaxID=1926495 RepID=UPI0023920B52|nr:hypothetical protein [Paraburkholderia sp.]MDE1184457.1 hypothetical protein [Paraburkholderia sp.]
MKNIIYFCPRINRPIGGIKVIHRHSELINTLGGQSEIYYDRPIEADTVDWFPHNAKIRTEYGFDPDSDLVILAESVVFDSWRRLKDAGVEYAIFVQNGYLVTESISQQEARECYAGAKHIICISDDAIRCVFQFFPQHIDKVIRVIYSVDSALFAPGEKENIITYMPRKMKLHSSVLVPLLEERLPENWRVVPIENMSEVEVATTLAKSRIFLAFSDFEGLPVPPVEAALAGNFVIGYNGQGGREYWNPPIFESIDSGDLVRFMDAVLKKVNDIDRYDLTLGDNHLIMLRDHFSKEMEVRMLKNMLSVIGDAQGES